jgi:hypothetical protein
MPQQSGSCTGFSIYWPILFYDIYNDNSDEYKKTIVNIYNFFNTKLQEIFTKENFNKETNMYLIMKILCNKFIDLNLLDNKLLENEIDFIYDRTINIKSFINTDIMLSYEYNIDLIKLFENFPNYFLDKEKKFIPYGIITFSNMYKIYNYSIINKIELFKLCNMEILKSFDTYIEKFLKETDNPKKHKIFILKSKIIKNNIVKLNDSFIISNNMHIIRYYDTCRYLINLNKGYHSVSVLACYP